MTTPTTATKPAALNQTTGGVTARTVAGPTSEPKGPGPLLEYCGLKPDCANSEGANSEGAKLGDCPDLDRTPPKIW